MYVLPRPVAQPQNEPSILGGSSNELLRIDGPHGLSANPHHLLNWTEIVGAYANSELEVSASDGPVALSSVKSLATTVAPSAAPHALPNEQPNNKRLLELLADAAHDIRAPIATAQQILASVLDRSRAGEIMTERDVRLLVGANQRLMQANRWSEEILTERNLSHRMIANIRRRFYPEQMRRGIQPLLASVAEEHRVQLEWLGWDRSMPRLYVDPDLLSRVLMNLVTNAVEASRPDGSVVIRIVWQNNVTQRLMITVEDQGVGLDAQLMRQVNSSKPWPERTAGTPLSGIGLRTAKTLLESMGGALSVQRGSMGGTTFRIALPIDDFRALVRSWIVQNAAIARRDQRTRLTMHSIKVSGMDSRLVDRELQRSAATNSFVYRIAADHWLWLSLFDSVNSECTDDIYATARRLSEIGKRSDEQSTCDAEMFFSMSDLPFGNLHNSGEQGRQLPYLTQLISSQVDQQLAGRVPPIDEILSTEHSSMKIASPLKGATESVDQPSEQAAQSELSVQSDPANATISEIAKQWRMIHSKLERLHSLHLKPAPML